MSKFTYKGPLSSISIEGKSTLLVDELELELPADHARVRALVERGHLVELKAERKKTTGGTPAAGAEPAPKTNEAPKSDEGPRSKRDGQKGVV